MLGIGAKGRLGNQLFQYATLYSVSKILDRRIVIIYKENNDIFVDFQLNIFPNISYSLLKEKVPFHSIEEACFKYDSTWGFVDKIGFKENLYNFFLEYLD